MSEMFKNTFAIRIGAEGQEEEFNFRVPTPLERARLGAKEAAFRKRLDPLSNLNVWDLDPYTFNLIRGFVVLETLLDTTSAEWVYTTDAKGEQRVDIEKFPAGKEDVVAQIGGQWQQELDRFHGRVEAP